MFCFADLLIQTLLGCRSERRVFKVLPGRNNSDRWTQRVGKDDTSIHNSGLGRIVFIYCSQVRRLLSVFFYALGGQADYRPTGGEQ